VPDGYFVFRSGTSNVFVFLRSFYDDPNNLIWFFTDYYSISPGMLSQTPGKGAKYMVAFTDRNAVVGWWQLSLKPPRKHSSSQLLVTHPLRG
jgi:hypothetical protein